jgi:hypothetical protein
VGVWSAAIAFVEAQCVPGKSVAELCAAGDELINKELAPKYKGKKVEKGIAFPTCLSLNNCCGHFSPLKEDSIDLKEGDVVKMCVCSIFFFFFTPHFLVWRDSTHEHNVHTNGSEVHRARDSIQWHSIQLALGRRRHLYLENYSRACANPVPPRIREAAVAPAQKEAAVAAPAQK